MRFLVVDDTYGWVKFHRENILNLIPDAEIDIAMNAQDGLWEIEKHGKNYYDLILSDMQMEEVEDERYAGIWLIKQIMATKKYHQRNIIIVSAVYNIKEVAKNLNVEYMSKSSVIAAPTVFEYKLKELLKL